jgi:hypothetical protein
LKCEGNRISPIMFSMICRLEEVVARARWFW